MLNLNFSMMEITKYLIALMNNIMYSVYILPNENIRCQELLDN